MNYGDIVAVYDSLSQTNSDTELVNILAECIEDADDDELGMIVGTIRGKVFEPWEDADIGVSSSLTQEAIETATGVSADQIETEWKESGDLGDAAAWAVENATQQSLFSEPLTLQRVHDTIRGLDEYEGEGSQQRSVDELAGLLSDATPEEARYIVRTALEHMRLGVGDGTTRDAVAKAFLDDSDAAIAAVERAYQVTTDYRQVAKTARSDGRDGLNDLDIELFRPMKMMLAKKAANLESGIVDVAEDAQDVRLEYKYDGARIQIHVAGDRVEVYTRRLENVTDQFPDVVAAVREHVSADRCLLDGEMVGYDSDAMTPVPFQEFSRRIKRKYDIDELAEEIPATVYLFDMLTCEGESLVNEPLHRRLEQVNDAFTPEENVIEQATGQQFSDSASAQSFYQSALSAGHEGVMLKNLEAAYQPGTRVGYMMKAKPVMEPLDLVVVRAKWSEGRRSDYLGRLFLGCKTTDDAEYAEVGRLSTGYTDEELAALTEQLQEHILSEDGRNVELEPAVVVQVEYEEIQVSPEYNSGYALRFPRFLDVRDDLAPEDADSIERIERLYEEQ
jgi:DNA ligase-1